MRLIDADALDRKVYNDTPIKVFGSIKKMAAVRQLIEDAPTVDVFTTVRKGEWIPNSDKSFFKCSCCGCGIFTPFQDAYRFCPNCGAKMTP